MKHKLTQLLQPYRRFAGRFVFWPEIFERNSIIYKSAHLLAAEKVAGDYLEFGVYAGSSFIQAYQVIQQVYEVYQHPEGRRTAEEANQVRELWESMRFFAFDSFEGLPRVSGLDSGSRDFARGQYACTEESFRANLIREGLPPNRIVTVAGWFEDTCKEATLRKHRMKTAAVIHIDCDLYSSAKTALDFVRPLLTDGSIIIFDDWYCFRGNPALGEQRAFSDWKRTMTGWEFVEYQKEGPWRNSFIASKRAVG